MFSELFIHIFDGLNRCCKDEIEAVRQQHPFKDLRYSRPTLRLTFQEGIQLLRDAGYDGECSLFVCVGHRSCAWPVGEVFFCVLVSHFVQRFYLFLLHAAVVTCAPFRKQSVFEGVQKLMPVCLFVFSCPGRDMTLYCAFFFFSRGLDFRIFWKESN